MYHPRNNKLLENARELRKNMTDAEKKLWYQFLCDVRPRFRRQEIIGSYIADFYCSKAKLVIELDGSQHFEQYKIEYDAARTSYFESLGITVIRIANNELFLNFEGVCDGILLAVNNREKNQLP